MTDKFRILMLKDGPETAYERYASSSELERMNKLPQPQNYRLVWEDILPRYTSMTGLLESLITRFAWSQPKGYHERAVSISDIIAITENGDTRFFYVNPIGFKEVFGFRFEFERGGADDAAGSE